MVKDAVVVCGGRANSPPFTPASMTETEIIADEAGQRRRVAPVVPSLHVYLYGGTPPWATACTSMQSPAQLTVTLVKTTWPESSMLTEKPAAPLSPSKV
jgi:hypothetical protein